MEDTVKDIVKAKLPVEIQNKKTILKIIYDLRTFEPCHGKEVEEWSHTRMKNIKYIVHVDNHGKISKTKIS